MPIPSATFGFPARHGPKGHMNNPKEYGTEKSIRRCRKAE